MPGQKNDGIALYQMTTQGRSIMLARHSGTGTLSVYGEGGDGSLYYLVYPHPDLNPYWDEWPDIQLVRLYPNGQREVLYDYYPCTIYLEKVGWLASHERDGTVAIRDLATGTVRHTRFNATHVQLSPDGNWAEYGGWGMPLNIVPVK
jgi:hypothetical protein